MSIKELEIPLRLSKIEALLKRYHETNTKYPIISEEYGRRMAGYLGEKSLKYYLSLLKDKNYLIFHNLRLPDTSGKHFFEIDLLLISPKFLLIIDAKNYRGELHFDGKFDQFIQTYEDKKKSYSCPIAQTNRHKLQLRKLLESSKYPALPIESLVVFTNPSSIITATSEHQQIHKVIKSTSLIPKIELFEKRNKKEILDKKQLQKLSKFLLKQHTPHDEDILKHFGITHSELIKGVRCPHCGMIPMNRTQRSWCCPTCEHSSKTAYLPSITDYYLLMGPEITNQKLREFLNLESASAAKHILKSLNLEYKGNLRHRVYFLPPYTSKKQDSPHIS